MASYLEDYGESQTRRSRKLRWLIIIPIATILIGSGLYLRFRDYGEYRRANRFLELTRNKDYKAAYALWGCTDATPCPQYPFDRFMEDWGPGGLLKNPEESAIAESMGCKTGVIHFIRAPGQEDIQLWVDRQTDEIGFAPWRFRTVPPGFRTQFAAFMWSLTQNCDPFIER